MKFTDAATLAGTRRTDDGYLIAEAFAVRTGVQHYARSEVGLTGDGMVGVYRPEEEVRAADSLRSFSHAPVTMGHPAESVTNANWKDLAVGEVSTEATWQDGKIKLPLILKDAAAITAVEAGMRELSAGYTCTLEFVDGIAPDGTSYQAVQRGIKINHLAVVPKGRAGSEFRIGDDAGARWGASPIINDRKATDMADANMRTVLVDGLSVTTTDQGAQALEKLTKTIADKDAALATRDADHAKAIAAKDAALAKAEAERDAEKAKVLTDAQIDAKVQARADLVGKAKAIHDADYAGKTDAEIRKMVVTAKLGDAAVEGKSEAYLDARFDILAEDAKPADPLRKALGDVKQVQDAKAEAEAARAKQLETLADGWSQPVTRQ